MMAFVVAAQKFVDQASHELQTKQTQRTVRQRFSSMGTKVDLHAVVFVLKRSKET